NTKTKEALVPYGMDPEGTMKKIVRMLLDKGYNTYSHENCISVSPPLIINEDQIKEGLAILDDVLDYVDTLVEE
ncbi:MAG: aspartate aminotransferase family protein, partial [Spirochaetales bacterium]|nr:aspartate aminotransferase family protein [Spirochaetales bacterium]